MTLILATLLATAPVGPYDTICSLVAKTTAVAIVAREAGVPLDKVMSVVSDIDEPTAQRIMRNSVLAMYSEPRVGAPFDEAEFISQGTAKCIIRLEREAKLAPVRVTPTGTPLNTERALIGVK